ncbi:hypothetical protein AAMO2058_000149400 [Amorphochlora amoebiformis]
MAEAKVRMDSLESKLDRVLALLDPRNEEEDGKKSGRAATNPMLPSVGMTQYVEEIEGLRKKLRATQDELAMAHQFLRKKQVKMYSEVCSLPVEQKVEKGGTSPRITRRGSMELSQMKSLMDHETKRESLKKSKCQNKDKSLFRLLKANDKKCYYLCPDYRIHHTPQSTNLIRLMWEDSPKTVLLIKKPRDPEVTKTMCDIAQWLQKDMKISVMVEPVVKNDPNVSHLKFLKTWKEEEFDKLNEIVDFVVCLGGDGTLLWLSNLFRKSVPPVISFAMGSLGFLTPFPASQYKHFLTQTIKGGFYLTNRARLQVMIERAPESTVKTENGEIPSYGKRPGSRRHVTDTAIPHLQKIFENIEEGLPPVPPAHQSSDPTDRLKAKDNRMAKNTKIRSRSQMPLHSTASNGRKNNPSPSSLRRRGQSAMHLGEDLTKENEKQNFDPEIWTALNEVIIDNGKSTSLTNLDCFCDGVFTTKCQGDGLIVATPTGSTAYSLSAGGSMVHPQVPGILFTPVCPHSLSFRPIVFPDTSKMKIKVSTDARSDHSVAFDGRQRQTLRRGDTVHVSVSAWPVPAICRVSETEDWFNGVRSLLHWNLRTAQKRDKSQKRGSSEN